MSEVIRKGKLAKEASVKLGAASTITKNNALEAIATILAENVATIITENEKDLKNLQEKATFTKAFYDRLQLTEERIIAMASGVKDIISISDPVGEVFSMAKRPNGLQVGKLRVPLGVIGIIYEARPNVTIDAAALSIKAGNAVILRGSSEAINSNKILVKLVREALSKEGLSENAVCLIEDTDRKAAEELMKLNDYLDVLIPRGGSNLINTVVANSTVPVIETGKGNCHTYIDDSAEIEMAISIAINAKTHRPGVCNAMETLLVHKDIAKKVLPELIKQLQGCGVEVRGCEKTMTFGENVLQATEEDWTTEYLDLILAIKVVTSINEAIEHINKYGTKHSEAIITQDYQNSRDFQAQVDAAAVYVNASTRYTDGFEFGLGAEMGISTQKLHARGPMGLQELTSTKFIIFGEGQVRS